MEIEKKKTRPTKRVFAGPTIRYHSLSMPLISEVGMKKESKMGNADNSNESSTFKIKEDENDDEE